MAAIFSRSQCVNIKPWRCEYRADSRFVPSQWETPLLCNDVSHWLGTNIESAVGLTPCRFHDLENNQQWDRFRHCINREILERHSPGIYLVATVACSRCQDTPYRETLRSISWEYLPIYQLPRACFSLWLYHYSTGFHSMMNNHDDIMIWIYFMYHWSFVRGIHWPPVASPHKGPVMSSFGVFFDVSLNKLLNIKPICWCFEMSWRWYGVNLITSLTVITKIWHTYTDRRKVNWKCIQFWFTVNWDFFNRDPEEQQLERLRSEIPPAVPWLPILVIDIRSQVKRRHSQSYKV